VQEIDEPCLDELRLRERRRHADDRLIGEEDGALGHGIDIAGETQSRQPVDEVLGESVRSPEVVERRLVEPESLEKIQHLLKASRHKKSASRRQLPNEKLEYRRVGHAICAIPLQHRELIEVREKRIIRVDHEISRVRRSAFIVAQPC
jgi:hypothetical protein